ncbi:hypothetical protein QFC22_004686 [Naganishia vaughanmartiniae]|uniref:Uncharacterized protein n=1 Tax=Naganishia vaughanmartiniae TaxID=1424756 RepID=A0ACC2X177_9TREE|nr:hypothetical protein QFC22_004686 [Naganishia vaughanmartiniae]
MRDPYFGLADKIKNCKGMLEELENLLKDDENSSQETISSAMELSLTIRSTLRNFLYVAEPHTLAMSDMIALDLQPPSTLKTALPYDAFAEHLAQFKVAWWRTKCLFPPISSVVNLRRAVRRCIANEAQGIDLEPGSQVEELRETLGDSRLSERGSTLREDKCDAVISLLDEEIDRMNMYTNEKHANLLKEGRDILDSLKGTFSARYPPPSSSNPGEVMLDPLSPVTDSLLADLKEEMSCLASYEAESARKAHASLSLITSFILGWQMELSILAEEQESMAASRLPPSAPASRRPNRSPRRR